MMHDYEKLGSFCLGRLFDAELEGELERIQGEYDIDQARIETINIRPRKTDISVTTIGLAWMPG